MGLCTICTTTLPKASNVAGSRRLFRLLRGNSVRCTAELPYAEGNGEMRCQGCGVHVARLLSYPTMRACAHCRSCTGWRGVLCLRLLVSRAGKGVCDGGAWPGSSPHAPLCQPWLGPKLLPKVQVNVSSSISSQSQVIMTLSFSCRVR